MLFWQLFLQYAGVLVLGAVKIDESREAEIKASFKSAFNLLSNKFVLLIIMSIILVAGVDAEYNLNSGLFLIISFGLEQTASESGRSVFFTGQLFVRKEYNITMIIRIFIEG